MDVQHGVVDRKQLRDLGLTDGAIEHRLNEQLFRVHQAVYAVGRPDLSQRGNWMAAVLACGEGAALSHESAAALWGILEADPGDPHVSVPPGRHPQHPGLAIHRRAHMPPTQIRDGINVVEPLYVLLDLAAPRSVGQIAALVNTADKLALLDCDEAAGEVARLPGRRGVRKLHQALAGHQVTDSDLERRFLALVADAGLARPVTQAVVAGFRVDFFWPELGLVVETDGLTYHRTPAQQAKDRIRDQAITAAGLTCLRFTNAQVRRDQRAVAATLRAVADRLRSTGHLRPK